MIDHPSQLWIGHNLVTSLEAEATRTMPCETGGVILGYYSADGGDLVITHALGPGPNAFHDETRFVPDHEFQVREIARLYHESGRRLQYLGDWHSHPGGSGELSAQDRATFQTIARCKEARAPQPVMLILAGGVEWQPHAWQYVRPRFWFWTEFNAEPLVISIY